MKNTKKKKKHIETTKGAGIKTYKRKFKKTHQKYIYMHFF
jgi:hypothetical protein